MARLSKALHEKLQKRPELQEALDFLSNKSFKYIKSPDNSSFVPPELQFKDSVAEEPEPS